MVVGTHKESVFNLIWDIPFFNVFRINIKNLEYVLNKLLGIRKKLIFVFLIFDKPI